MKTDRVPKGHAIRRLGFPERLAESLQERILSGEFKEGEQLIQEAIALEYDVSRMPVREALRQLEARGLVEMKLHKGAVVTSVPIEQIAELFDLRAILEVDLLTHALPQMTPADLDRASTVLEDLETAYHQADTARFGELNWAFHRSLYLPSQRVQTLGIVQSINVQTDRYIRLQLAISHSSTEAETEHRQLLELCAQGNVKAAVTLLKRHILETGRSLIASLVHARAGKAA